LEIGLAGLTEMHLDLDRLSIHCDVDLSKGARQQYEQNKMQYIKINVDELN
jgi:hypothetical protein